MAPVGGGFGRKDDITTEIHAGLAGAQDRPARAPGLHARRVALRADQAASVHDPLQVGRARRRTPDRGRSQHLRRQRPVSLTRDVCDQEGRHPRDRPVLRAQREGGHLHRHDEQPDRRRDARLRRAADCRRARVADGHARARARHVTRRIPFDQLPQARTDHGHRTSRQRRHRHRRHADAHPRLHVRNTAWSGPR